MFETECAPQVSGTDSLGNEVLTLLRAVRGVRRVALVYGDGAKVQRDLAGAEVYARQLESSRILVVPVVEASGEAAVEKIRRKCARVELGVDCGCGCCCGDCCGEFSGSRR